MARYRRAASNEEVFGFLGGCLIWVAVILASIAGVITHIIHCIRTEEWFLLIAGAICAPIGAIHGWGLWFGWWG